MAKQSAKTGGANMEGWSDVGRCRNSMDIGIAIPARRDERPPKGQARDDIMLSGSQRAGKGGFGLIRWPRVRVSGKVVEFLAGPIFLGPVGTSI